MAESISEEVLRRVKEWAATTSDPVMREAGEIGWLRRPHYNHKYEIDPLPGRQRHFTGREGVPQLSPGEIRGMRMGPDQRYPETLPSEVKVIRIR